MVSCTPRREKAGPRGGLWPDPTGSLGGRFRPRCDRGGALGLQFRPYGRFALLFDPNLGHATEPGPSGEQGTSGAGPLSLARGRRCFGRRGGSPCPLERAAAKLGPMVFADLKNDFVFRR